jgi:pimeloyl-ACP methyl ester carboxylesterase
MLIRKIMLLLAILLLVGGCFEFYSKYSTAKRFPPPGKLIDIGGRNLHLDCRGSGQPTVVLQSGLDNYGSLSWSAVHDAIAKTTRVCAYDRAGIMWSDAPADTDNKSVSTAEDLHLALSKAGEQMPLVLVGHSLGGIYTMVYARQYPDDVAAMVLIDGTHPDIIARSKPYTQRKTPLDEVIVALLDITEPILQYAGLIRLAGKFNDHRQSNQSVEDAASIRAYSPSSKRALLDEDLAHAQTLLEGEKSKGLGDIPLLILGTYNDWNKMSDQELQESNLNRAIIEPLLKARLKMKQEQATWSTQGELKLLLETHHYVQFDRPGVVIGLVKSMVEKVRRGTLASAEGDPTL